MQQAKEIPLIAPINTFGEDFLVSHIRLNWALINPEHDFVVCGSNGFFYSSEGRPWYNPEGCNWQSGTEFTNIGTTPREFASIPDDWDKTVLERPNPANVQMPVSEKINQFIQENGGNERDALNIALARLEVAERVFRQISEAGGALMSERNYICSNSTSALGHADNTIKKMRDLSDSFLDNYPTVLK